MKSLLNKYKGKHLFIRTSEYTFDKPDNVFISGEDSAFIELDTTNEDRQVYSGIMPSLVSKASIIRIYIYDSIRKVNNKLKHDF